MYDEEIEYIVDVWNRCNKKEKISKTEINNAMALFNECCIKDNDFKRLFDSKTSIAFHRNVMIDLENYVNTL